MIKKIAIAIAAVILVAVPLGFIFCTAKVPAGHVGIITTFGKVSNDVRDSGFQVKSPFAKVNLMDVREQKEIFSTEGSSKDMQIINVSGSVNFTVSKPTAMNLFQSVGMEYYDVIVQPRLLENTKNVLSRYPAESMVTQRSELAQVIQDELAAEMEVHGIVITNLSIENLGFDPDFEQAIERRQVREQERLAALTEAETKKIQAQADADAAKINAQGAADAREIEAKGVAAANKMIQDSLTQGVLEYNKVEKWNGQNPSVVVGNGGGASVVVSTQAGNPLLISDDTDSDATNGGE